MPEKFIKQFGLKKLPRDRRDFKLSAILKLPPLEELPDEFELPVINVKNQGVSDFCTAYATCGTSELQEGMELNPFWSFAVSKMISGDVDEYGQDLRTAMKVHTKYGAVEEKEIDYWRMSDLKGEDEIDIQRHIENYPKELFEKAKKHQKQSFFKVEGQYDPFDDIRAAIWHFKTLKRAVALGVEWGWSLGPAIIPNELEGGGGHAIYAIGWKKINGETYLTIQNSYGKEVGDNGKHYFPRRIINEYVKRYGCFMFVDMPIEEAKKKSWSIGRRFWELIKSYFK